MGAGRHFDHWRSGRRQRYFELHGAGMTVMYVPRRSRTSVRGYTGYIYVLAALILLGLAAPGRAAEPQTPVASSTPIRPLLDQYCVACHNTPTKAGGFVLEGVDADHIAENVPLWEKV